MGSASRGRDAARPRRLSSSFSCARGQVKTLDRHLTPVVKNSPNLGSSCFPWVAVTWLERAGRRTEEDLHRPLAKGEEPASHATEGLKVSPDRRRSSLARGWWRRGWRGCGRRSCAGRPAVLRRARGCHQLAASVPGSGAVREIEAPVGQLRGLACLPAGSPRLRLLP